VTTASNAACLPFRENRFVQRLSLGMAAILLYTGMRPEKAFDWWLENILALAFLIVLASTYRRLPLSDVSYLLIFVFLALHEWGAQYKYAHVPLGEWMKDWLNTSRNHYDRLMHFHYGLLLAYPMQEWFMRSAGVWTRWRYFLPVLMTLACSATYEILEFSMAFVLSPESAHEFVGIQGDLWDSQKDMLLAGVGSVLAMVLVSAARKVRQLRPPKVAEPGYALTARYKLK
jgi:putative membrane protein